ncbi:hypothetical protein QEN19_000539 [Hanseniaspora menglaensis]
MTNSSSEIVYEPGTRCWYPDKESGWIGGEILSKNYDTSAKVYTLELKLEDGRKISVETSTLKENDLTDFADSSVQKAISEATNTGTTSFLPLLRNPPILETTEDLTSLSYLNEPAVLHAIKARYAQLNIYSYSGIVLIAANPFDKVDELYSKDMIQAYAGRRRGELEPHLFAIAEEAYSLMKNEGKNQTIVVSGESGAGKTVSAKYIMRYFASVEEIHKNGGIVSVTDGSDENGEDKVSETEEKILATNPIMEAFGNAKTTRNDNSSRFGKYLEILFDENTSIIGAKIRTYLLERSRLVFQPSNERNYHIFYQMLKGLSDEDKEELSLKDIQSYKYLNQGGSYEIDGIDDKNEFDITCKALALVGIDAAKQQKIFKTLAALLHIGNIEITKTRNDASLSLDEPNLQIACKLLNLDPAQFTKWIVKKQITTRSEKIISNLSYQQALVARDSVAKFIYSALFDWLVETINVTLCNPEVEHKVKNFIGVLDIYGFEHFQKNSFEQFCINYANEKLQQEFNQHVFKLEQEEYVREQIEWSFIEFNDNQPCINLIEDKVGILSLLDEESRLPAGDDKSWASKLIDTLDKPPTDKVFSKTRFGQDKFIVKHYALDVEYDSDGFVEKNRDTVSEGHLEVLKKTENSLLIELLTIIDEKAAALEAKEQEASASNVSKKPMAKSTKKKPTLGSIFKNSLIELMATINSTNVHYIRCIKPNDTKASWEFDNLMVLSQLRACGVLETIRISCAGFPSRWTYNEFVSRYHILTSSEHWGKLYSAADLNIEDIKTLTEKILSVTDTDQSKYQLGLEKVFFKAGMLAHLEKLRNDKQQQAIIQIQKKIKAKFWRNWFLETTASLKLLQSLIHGAHTRNVIDTELKTESAILIQKNIRALKVRKETQQIIESVIKIQSVLRMKESQKQFLAERQSKAAIAVQKRIRSFTPRKNFLQERKSTVVVQSLIRRRFAKTKLKTLKTEAESVNNLKEVSYQLENKVIELSESLAEKIKENKELNVRITELQENLATNVNLQEVLKLEKDNNKKSLEGVHKQHSSDVKSYEDKLAQAKSEMEAVLVEVEQIKIAKEELKKEIQSKLNELQQTREQLSTSNTINSDLQNEVASLKSEIQRLQAALATGVPSINTNRSIVASPVKNDIQSTPVSKRFSHISQTNVFDSPGSLMSPIPNETNSFIIDDDRSINAVLNDINDDLYNLFNDTGPLISEIVSGLLSNFKTPETTTSINLSRKEVLYPARILIIILSDMWRLGLTKQSENFLAEVLSTIQKIVSGIKGDDLIPGGAFWLTNVRELYSFVVYAEKTILHDDSYNDGIDDAEFKEYLKLVADLRDDFEALSYNVYNLWVKKLEKDLEKKIVPAVVLHQALPGFVSSENSNLLPKFFASGTPSYKMDDILTFLNNIYWSLKNYHVEAEIFTSVITTLLRFIDAVAFNDIIMRKNFLSWKRGLQLHYNVTRLEEWCRGHHIAEGTDCLKHMMQVAKLLQIKKATTEDIDIVFEVCSALKPVQIQKLLSLYAVADYETPLPENIAKYLAEKVKNSDKSGKAEVKTNSKPVFLPMNSGPFKDPYATLPTREFGKIEAYIPTWLNLPITKQIVKLVTEHVQYQESGDVIEQLEYQE